MVYKLNTYMISGVSEYWIVDSMEQRITIYDFKDCQVEKMELYKDGDIARSLFFDGLKVNVEELFANLL